MRLIDADELRDEVLHDTTHPNEIVNYYLYAIDYAPTIDAVPVVRCVECKHYNTTGCSVGFGWCESMDRGVSDEFYCSCGAKMEDKPCE